MSSGATWMDTYERLSSLDPSGLTAEQLEALADAAWLQCRLDESTAAPQQSYMRYLDAGENGPAARAAWRLFWKHLYGGGAVVAISWLRRARRHLATMPETAEHGLVALADAELALNRGPSDWDCQQGLGALVPRGLLRPHSLP